jgi:hypothetical protein
VAQPDPSIQNCPTCWQVPAFCDCHDTDDEWQDREFFPCLTTGCDGDGNGLESFNGYCEACALPPEKRIPPPRGTVIL